MGDGTADVARWEGTAEEKRPVLFAFDPRAASLCLGPALLWIEEKKNLTLSTHENPVEESLWEGGVCMSGGTGTSLEGFLRG